MTIKDIKEICRANGRNYFLAENMKFFKAQIERDTDNSNLFIESIGSLNNAGRIYMVKGCCRDGELKIIEPLRVVRAKHHFDSVSEAENFRSQISKELGKFDPVNIKETGYNTGVFIFENKRKQKRVIDTNEFSLERDTTPYRLFDVEYTVLWDDKRALNRIKAGLEGVDEDLYDNMFVERVEKWEYFKKVSEKLLKRETEINIPEKFAEKGYDFIKSAYVGHMYTNITGTDFGEVYIRSCRMNNALAEKLGVTDKILENNLLGKKPVKVNTLVKKSKEVERD